MHSGTRLCCDPNWNSGNWRNHWDWSLRTSHAFSAQCAEKKIINQIVTPSFRKFVTSFSCAAWYLLDLMSQDVPSWEGLGFPTGWGWVFSHQDKKLKKCKNKNHSKEILLSNYHIQAQCGLPRSIQNAYAGPHGLLSFPEKGCAAEGAGLNSSLTSWVQILASPCASVCSCFILWSNIKHYLQCLVHVN